MPLKVELFDVEKQVRYQGKYSFEEIYLLIREFFDSRRYDTTETLYKDKKADVGYDIEIHLDIEKRPSEFVKYETELWFHFFGVDEKEVNGRKITSGKLHFMIKKANVIFDYQGKFKKHEKWLNLLVGTFLKRYYQFYYIVPFEDDIKELFEDLKKKYRE